MMKILTHRDTGKQVIIPDDATIRIRCDGQVTLIEPDGAETVYDSYYWDHAISWSDMMRGLS